MNMNNSTGYKTFKRTLLKEMCRKSLLMVIDIYQFNLGNGFITLLLKMESTTYEIIFIFHQM